MKRLLLIWVLSLFYFACSKNDDNSNVAPVKYTVSFLASEGGSVNTSGGLYNENTFVLITATPDEGYEFSGWTGTTLTGSIINVKVTSNQTITANFIRSIYSLTIDIVGKGEIMQQIINSKRETEEYESGKTIRLTATPQSDFLFYDWGYLQNDTIKNSYDNPFEVVMDTSKTVTGTFEEKLPIVNPENTDKNNTVGKWKIRKKGPGTRRFSGKAVDCEVNEIIFRSNNSFTIITEASTITGLYAIDSETSISLNQGGTNIGNLTELILTESYISFKIDLTGVCDEQLEADKDKTYDETTDSLATNTGSSTSELESSTINLEPCKIETSLNSDNANQTIGVGDSIQDITIDVTVGSTCTETLSVSSSNLPEGVTVSLDNNQITIQGTPSSNSIGSFDYEIILNLADPEAILTGSIIVDNNTTTETNQNSGGGGTDSSSNTTNDNIISSSPDSSTSSDTVSPVQTLIGESTVTLYVGDRYIEQGAFGIDDVDGNISNLMEIDNQSVNTSSPGTYIVSYDTKDAAGNQAITIYRTVIVLENTSNIDTSTSSSTNSGTSTVTSDTNSTLDTFTINVTASSSSDYTLSGSDRIGSVSGADPSVTVNVGDNLNFSIDAIGHPFYLKTVQGTGINDLISDVSNNGIVEGTVSWSPTVAGTYYYQCSLHNAMYGVINVN
mgnify:FL=1